ncbi:hypothetical protein CPC08DRAFT_726769 [Agrocybe pediades]|nr:hypothetical protein CPC08DRAFT_726769 [Agrocybe pediades]
MPYHSTGLDSGSSQLLGTPSQREASQREGAGAYGAGESEGDGDVALRGPLKKKRRRQALSCTECKRRKIKCDRTQPCTPCMRRGEEAGCQWHIVEPVEKYATKAEFEELKARYNELAALVHRLLPAPAAVAPYYQMGVQSSGMPGVPGEAVQSYNNPGTTSSSTAGAGGYSAIMPPPQPPQHQQQGSYSQHMETPTQVTSRLYIKPEEAHSPTRQHASHPHQSSLSVQNASPSTLASAGHNSILTRHRLPDSSPTLAASTVKMSPLSLSSITSPFHPDQQAQSQSKNCRAQTLILGERLRPGSEDPVISILLTIPAIQTIYLIWTAAAQVLLHLLHPYLHLCPPTTTAAASRACPTHGESVILPLAPSSYPHPETIPLIDLA